MKIQHQYNDTIYDSIWFVGNRTELRSTLVHVPNSLRVLGGISFRDGANYESGKNVNCSIHAVGAETTNQDELQYNAYDGHRFFTNGTGGGTGNTERLTILGHGAGANAGNVGIGKTPDSDFKLDVNGKIKSQGTITATKFIGALDYSNLVGAPAQTSSPWKDGYGGASLIGGGGGFLGGGTIGIIVNPDVGGGGGRTFDAGNAIYYDDGFVGVGIDPVYALHLRDDGIQNSTPIIEDLFCIQNTGSGSGAPNAAAGSSIVFRTQWGTSSLTEFDGAKIQYCDRGEYGTRLSFKTRTHASSLEDTIFTDKLDIENTGGITVLSHMGATGAVNDNDAYHRKGVHIYWRERTDVEYDNGIISTTFRGTGDGTRTSVQSDPANVINTRGLVLDAASVKMVHPQPGLVMMDVSYSVLVPWTESQPDNHVADCIINIGSADGYGTRFNIIYFGENSENATGGASITEGRMDLGMGTKGYPEGSGGPFNFLSLQTRNRKYATDTNVITMKNNGTVEAYQDMSYYFKIGNSSSRSGALGGSGLWVSSVGAFNALYSRCGTTADNGGNNWMNKTDPFPFKIVMGTNESAFHMDTAGNVGIGTRTPIGKLQVAEATNDADLDVVFSAAQNGNCRLVLQRNHGTQYNSLQIGGENTVIGDTYYPDWCIENYNGGPPGAPDNAIGLRFQSKFRDQAANDAATTEDVLFLGFRGNVGIGIAEPSEKLDVNGDIKASSFKATGTDSVGGFFVNVNNSASPRVYLYTLGEAGALLLTDANAQSSVFLGGSGNTNYFADKNLGIGTTQPQAPLEIRSPYFPKTGTGAVSDPTNHVYEALRLTAEYEEDWGSPSNHEGGVSIKFTMDNQNQNYWPVGEIIFYGENGDNLEQNGGFLFRTSSNNDAASGQAVGPQAGGNVNALWITKDGALRAANNITAYYSDARLKTFTGKITNSIEKIKQLNGYYFVENELAKSLGYNNDRVQVGVSAQEVEKVLPEIVTKASPIKGKMNEEGEYKTIWYEKLTPLFIEGIKSQQQQIESQQQQIESQQQQIESQQQQINELKEMMKALLAKK
tara:strand:+ start:81 stop:3254 length:3174 start_codon:yes stop_codon:yes gene_type:complete